MTRVCLDSNVLVAAFVARGLCADLLRVVLAEHQLIVPAVVAEEVRRVLVSKLGAGPEEVSAVNAIFEQAGIVPTGMGASPLSLRDPDDERVLADALAAGAEILVTGDHDLLVVAGDAPIRILSPRGFLGLVREGRG